MPNPPRELGCFTEPSLFPFSGQYQHFQREYKKVQWTLLGDR